MSAKTKLALASALATIGQIASSPSALPEPMLNDVSSTRLDIVETAPNGGAIVVASGGTGINAFVQGVGDSFGAVKLFSRLDAAITAAKRARMVAGGQIVVHRFARVAAVADPLTALKNRYKAAHGEGVQATNNLQGILNSITASEALGSQNAQGSPEYDQWVELNEQKIGVTAWKNAKSNEKSSLAAALFSANIDPNTVVPGSYNPGP